MIGQLLSIILVGELVAACMTIRPSSGLEETVSIVAEGDLPQVDARGAKEIIANSQVPVALMFSLDSCVPCKKVKPALWRTVRKSKGRFLAAIVDSDKNRDFWQEYGQPALPSIIIFEKGKARWQTVGVGDVEEMLDVLVENSDGFVHDLKTRGDAMAPTNARVFLVAATADSAAFAQEVLDQVDYWKAAGLADDQIACYWSLPNFPQYLRDKKQFRSIGPLLERCYNADINLIEDHWKQAAAQHPEWMYLYVSSHGIGDAQAQAAAQTVKAVLKEETTKQCDAMAQAQLFFDPLPPQLEDLRFSEIFARACIGGFTQPPGLNRDRMQKLLKETSGKTSKTIVLQGCHSGAVVPEKLPLATVVLAAARPDRSSFGCNPEGDRTVYGEEVLAAMKKLKPLPGRFQDWQRVHHEVARRVDQREQEMSIPKGTRSLPMIFSEGR